MAQKPQKEWKNRIIGHGEEDPENLLANPRNARVHPRFQKEALRGILNQVGWVQSVIVNQRTNFVVDGHARIEVAMQAKEKTIPVAYVDLSPEEEDMILASMDAIGALAEWDKAALGALVEGIQTDDQNLARLLANLAAEDAGGSKAVKQLGEVKWDTELKQENNYVILQFRNAFDWNVACAIFGLETECWLKSSPSEKFRHGAQGIGRVVDGAAVVEEIKKARGL